MNENEIKTKEKATKTFLKMCQDSANKTGTELRFLSIDKTASSTSVGQNSFFSRFRYVNCCPTIP